MNSLTSIAWSPRDAGRVTPRTRRPGLLLRLAAFWIETERLHRDAQILATMSDHLLYDIGITRDGAASLARRLRETPAAEETSA